MRPAIVRRLSAAAGGLAAALALAGNPVSGADRMTPAADAEAQRLVRAQLQVVRCGSDRYVYGVGYLDGSYMERLFLVREPGADPRTSVVLGEAPSWPRAARGELPADLPARSFSLEVDVPEARFAVPAAQGWTASDADWAQSLRFKYYHWFGELSRHAGEWRIAWQGYRKPMLPVALAANPAEACVVFGAD